MQPKSDVPEHEVQFVKVEVASHPHKIGEKFRFYSSVEIVKEESSLYEDDVPYNYTYRTSKALVNFHDLSVGDTVYVLDYNGFPMRGIVDSLNEEEGGGEVAYPQYGSLRGLIEFSKDERHCWCQCMWMDIGDCIEDELVSIGDATLMHVEVEGEKEEETRS